MGKFANSLGVWDLDLGGVSFELKPTFKEVRKFRKIMVDEKNKTDKNFLFDSFADYMFELIKQFNPTEPDDDIKEYVEVNINPLFEETMIKYRWSTKEDMDKAKAETVAGAKKLMSSD